MKQIFTSLNQRQVADVVGRLVLVVVPEKTIKPTQRTQLHSNIVLFLLIWKRRLGLVEGTLVCDGAQGDDASGRSHPNVLLTSPGWPRWSRPRRSLGRSHPNVLWLVVVVHLVEGTPVYAVDGGWGEVEGAVVRLVNVLWLVQEAPQREGEGEASPGGAPGRRRRRS